MLAHKHLGPQRTKQEGGHLMSQCTQSGGGGDGVRHDPVRDEVSRWFFDDYLPTWGGVGSGAIARGPGVILDYGGGPWHISTPTSREWVLDRGAGQGWVERTD